METIRDRSVVGALAGIAAILTRDAYSPGLLWQQASPGLRSAALTPGLDEAAGRVSGGDTETPPGFDGQADR